MASRTKRKVSLSRLLSYLGCIRPRADEAELVGKPGYQRQVFCNDHEKHSPGSPHHYCSNAISTTKYSALTFLPKSIFEQFRRVANFYFLLCAIVALTPLTPYTPASLIAPLVLVVSISIIKEGIEDWRRYLADDAVNKRLVDVHVGGGHFEPREWRRVVVGDIVRVTRDEFFPADLLLLASSYADGICYVETMNLDGETNLKLRKALERTKDLANSEGGETEESDNLVKGFADFQAEVLCEDPNPNLYTFVGNLTWNGEVTALGPQQLLLRDSKLRNTAFVFGAVIFTGHDTKAMQNALAIPSKRSRVEKRMDKLVYGLFGTIVTLAVTGSIAFGVILRYETPAWWYLEPWNTNIYYDPSSPAASAVIQCITAIVLYGYLIPISLYVSIEIVKIFQAWFISADLQMYDAPSDTPARARTSNLNEELGQVDTVLSDKTGTLTCNRMEFLKCCVAGVAYGRGITEVERATATRLGVPLSSLADYDEEVERQDWDAATGSLRARQPLVKGFALRDDRLTNGRWLLQPDAAAIRAFLRLLALCNTVVTEAGEGGHVDYEAESPDEAAFVEAARQLGCELVERRQSSVRVRERVGAPPEEGQEGQWEDREYEVLHILEFTSARKRMSVVVRDPEGAVLVLAKGADSVMFERLARDGREHLAATRAHLQRYAEAGLRTLVLAQRPLPEEWYAAWRQRYEAARTSLGEQREALIEAAAEELERELALVGATAVEDKLQEGVPAAIDRLAQAGIKLWVLTGDKMETAINIGFACSLLRDGMQQILISLDSPAVRKLEEEGDQQRLEEGCRSLVAQQLERGVALVEGRASAPVAAEGRAAATADDSAAESSAAGAGDGVPAEAGGGGAESAAEAAEGDRPMGDGEANGAVEGAQGAGGSAAAGSEAPVFALVIDGRSLAYAVEGAMRPRLLALAMQCASVICCRVSPKQKALMTRLVREGAGCSTLAIGDGANDVGMIQEANIGVGISGVEGQQAVMVSDFAIAQFRFLERLLLVQGHWCYWRIAGMITYYFYKNVFFGLTFFYYNAYSVFSGQVPYDSWAAASYNVFFTSLPVIAFGVLDQDLPAKALTMFPALYREGQRNTLFSWRAILLHILNGVYGSVVLFWAAFFAVALQASSAAGFLFELPGTGATLMGGVVLAANLHMAILVQHWTWLTHLLLYLSIFLWFLFLIVYSYFPAWFATSYVDIFPAVLAPSALFWLTSVLLLPAMAVLPFFALRAALALFSPSDRQLVRELILQRRDEEAARQAAGAPRAPVGFSAAVAAVSQRIGKADRRRRRRLRL